MDPLSELATSTYNDVVISSGVVTDIAGNAYNGSFGMSFTTGP